VTQPGMMCLEFNASISAFGGIKCARGECKSCGPEREFTRHACTHEADPGKSVSLKLIQSVDQPGGIANLSRPHFETKTYTRQDFQAVKVKLMKEFVRHFYFARHQRRALQYIATDFMRKESTRIGPSKQPFSPNARVKILLLQIDFSEKFRHTTNFSLNGQQFKATEVLLDICPVFFLLFLECFTPPGTTECPRSPRFSSSVSRGGTLSKTNSPLKRM